MFYNKKTIIKSISLLTLVGISIFVFFGISKNKKAVKEKILVQVEDIYQNVSLPAGDISQANALERHDFSSFNGLPSKEDKEFYKNYSLIYSENKDEIALVSFIGSEENKDKQKEFICSLSEKKCQQGRLFFNKYQVDNLDIMARSILWLGWNSKNNIVIGLATDSVNNGTLYVCDIDTKLCNKNIESKLNFPNGAINKSFDKTIAIKQNDIVNEKIGDRWELLLYDIVDLNKPIGSYDISQAINKDEDLIYDGVNSIAWSTDEKFILIGTTRNIFKFNLEKNSLEKIFTDISTGEGDTYWNSDYVKFSPSERYVIFIDNSNSGLTGEENSEDEEQRLLKIIDLKNKNKVTELLGAKNLTLI